MSADPVVITVSGEAPEGLVTEQEYAARESARPPISSIEYVDTEAKLDAALIVGGDIYLKGVINCTTPKEITKAYTTISGPGHLRFDGLAPDARCLLVQATDVTLRNFEMSSTLDLALSSQSGINFPAYEPSRSHRAKLRKLDLHNWHTCISKYGGIPTPYTDDILIEDCYLHVWRYGFYLTFGLRRLTIRRCRVLGKQDAETHTSDGNAGYIGSNTEDVLVEDCVLGNCDRMGLEITPVPKTVNLRPRLLRSRIVNTKGFGVSYGHCIQGYAENVIVDGAGGVGFEVAGNDATGRVKDTILIGCDVRNVTDPIFNRSTAAYTIDKADDVIFLGCRATNITSATSNLANGIYVYNAERAAILNCVFMDAGATAIHLFNGGGPNTGGFHIVEGCTFRHSVNVAYQKAIFVSNINTIARNNTAFQRQTGTMGFAASCSPGAVVHFDGTTPIATGQFAGSNKIITVPA